MTVEEEAAKLLPCTWIPVGCQEVADRNAWCLNCRQRPAVAERLRERDEHFAALNRIYERTRSQLRERIAALEAAIEKAADTFEDFHRVMKMLGREAVAQAAKIAGDAARAALAGRKS